MQMQHEMVLQQTHSSGAEEWYCPTCGRRMAITWQPWKRIVLEAGDVFAGHRAAKGGLQVKALGSTESDPDDLPASAGSAADDPYLAPWLRWLDRQDPDDL